MRVRRVTAALATLAVGWAAMAHAAPFAPNFVSRDTNWLFHFDGDAAKTSVVVQKVKEELARQIPASEQFFDNINREWGIDLRKDLHGVTAYGPRFGRHEMVLIVSCQVDKDALLREARQAPDHKTAKYRDYEIHLWTDAKGTSHSHQGAGAFYKPDVLVFATGLEPLQMALDVLDGKAPSLADRTSPLTESVPEGTIFLARAVEFDASDFPHKPPVVNIVKQFSYAKGEHDGHWFGRLNVVTDSEQAAAQLKDILRGVRAMVSIHFRNQPDAVKLLSQVDFKVEGTSLHGELTANVDQVKAVVPMVVAAIKEHVGKRAAGLAREVKQQQVERSVHVEKERSKSGSGKLREARRERAPAQRSSN